MNIDEFRRMNTGELYKLVKYDQFLSAIGESPLSKVESSESAKSVYRLAIQPGWLGAPPHSLIQITDISHSLTVMLKTEKFEETINIDPSDRLFYERFRFLQENIEQLNFWSMESELNRGFDGADYIIEVAHHGKHKFSSCWCPKEDGNFRKLCQLFLDLPCYVGSILEGQVRNLKESWVK